MSHAISPELETPAGIHAAIQRVVETPSPQTTFFNVLNNFCLRLPYKNGESVHDIAFERNSDQTFREIAVVALAEGYPEGHEHSDRFLDLTPAQFSMFLMERLKQYLKDVPAPILYMEKIERLNSAYSQESKEELYSLLYPLYLALIDEGFYWSDLSS